MNRRAPISCGQSDCADLLAGTNIVTIIDRGRAQMPVNGPPSITMNDENRQSLTREGVADIGYTTSGSRDHCRSGRGSNIDPVVALAQTDWPKAP